MISKFDLQGHRGCRGLFPENTIEGFIHAVKLGVTTLEMDVVISKDMQVVISHEPWMNPEICSTPDGNPVEGNGMQYNIFQMNYEEVKKFDCGIRGHNRFKLQQKIQSYKPLLTEMIDEVEKFCQKNGFEKVGYNIETKCLPAGDNIFHPAPEIFSALVYDVLKTKDVIPRSNIQSFDYRTLKYFHQHYPEVMLAMLLHDHEDMNKRLSDLGFVPEIYSPHFKTINKTLIDDCHKLNMKVIPWTINDISEMKRLVEIGVDGLITDYPDIAVAHFSN